MLLAACPSQLKSIPSVLSRSRVFRAKVSSSRICSCLPKWSISANRSSSRHLESAKCELSGCEPERHRTLQTQPNFADANLQVSSLPTTKSAIRSFTDRSCTAFPVAFRFGWLAGSERASELVEWRSSNGSASVDIPTVPKKLRRKWIRMGKTLSSITPSYCCCNGEVLPKNHHR